MMAYLRDINLLSVIVRMLLAVLCGGVIGFQREKDGKDAGTRTHMMICVGSAMVTATSEYLFLVLHQFTDVARLGAQVIAGLGFIGAGTIVVTQYRRVRGLTTAAGLWVIGIIGLCCGAGFYEGALLATLLLLFASEVIGKLEKKRFATTTNVDMFMEYDTPENLRSIMVYLRDVDVLVEGFELDRSTANGKTPNGIFHLKLHRKITPDDIISDLKNYGCVSKIYTL